ncbi:MAG: hypothetical protein AAB577_00340 [Patescibacteria group bacterium]
MKKIVLAIFLFSIILVPTISQAALVSCGLTPDDSCQLCDFFDLISDVLNFAMKMVMVIAALMFTAGGAFLLFAGADPKQLQTGKNIIFSTIKGFVIIFTAFMVVGTILSALGMAQWTQDIYKNWWSDGFFQIPGC